MAEVDATVPNSDAMEGIEATEEPPSAPLEDEYSCETLYIQNLNEKIKPEGFAIFYQVMMILNFKPTFFFPQFSRHRYVASSNHTVKCWTLLHITTCACEVRRLFRFHQLRLQRMR
jgi:hypothetical protein